MNKCIGCGDLISDDKTLCERCFRIRNYNEYKVVTKNNNDFIEILKKINETNDLVILVDDLFNLSNLKQINKYLSNDILLVLTKRDILPKSLNIDKLYNYDYGINYVDKVVVSSKNNYQFDLLLELINKYKKSNRIYVVGYTNSGKSTLINKLIYNYSNNDTIITTSPLPNTTLNTIEVCLNEEITLIDTPGILEENDLVNYLSGNEIKKVIPNKEIKPITYQIKDSQYIIIDDYAIIETNDIDLTLFISNKLNVKRMYGKYKGNLLKHTVSVDNNDVVIKGLGFIKTNKKGIINIYTTNDISIYTRDSLI